MNLIDELHEKGKTIMIITHDMPIVAEHARRVVVMNKGQIALEGTPEQVFSQTEKLHSLSLRSPQVTVLAQKLGLEDQTILRVSEMVNWLKDEYLSPEKVPMEIQHDEFDLKSRSSPLQKLDGRTKLLFLAVVFILVLLYSHPLYITILLALVMVVWWIARLPFQMIKDLLKFFLMIALIILVVQIFFYPGTTPLVRLSNPLPAIGFSGFITLEGILFGVAMVLRLVVIMIVAPLMVMTTPLPELMLALVKLKVPYRFAFIMTTALSLLPSIQNRAFHHSTSPALPRYFL